MIDAIFFEGTKDIHHDRVDEDLLYERFCRAQPIHLNGHGQSYLISVLVRKEIKPKICVLEVCVRTSTTWRDSRRYA